jgi:pyruvate,water dikinase
MGYLIPISSIRKRDIIGNKARSILYLHRKRFRIPQTFVLPIGVHKDYLNDRSTTLIKLKSELIDRLDWSKQYAIRSSAEIEDGLDNSYAGQFKTMLNVKGWSRVLEAIQEVWNTSVLLRTSPYRSLTDAEETTIHMAVIVQEMVEPLWAGVAFSINPITGRDEIVIEGV